MAKSTRTRVAPAPSGASKTVGPRQAASFGKAQRAKAKVANVKARSAQAGATTDAAEKMAKYLPHRMSRQGCVDYLKAHGAYAGHSRDSVTQLREAVAKVQQANEAGDRLAAEVRPKAEAAGIIPAKAEPEAPQAATDRVERVRLAKAEHKLLQAWINDGSKPPRPATPNLDAVEAEHQAGGTSTQRQRKAKGQAGTTRTREVHPDVAKAAQLKADKYRRSTRKVDDAELVAIIEASLAERPTCTMWQHYEVAYWLGEISLNRPRWRALFEQVTAGKVAA